MYIMKYQQQGEKGKTNITLAKFENHQASTGFKLTFQGCIVKNCEKITCFMSHKGPQWLGMKDRIF